MADHTTHKYHSRVLVGDHHRSIARSCAVVSERNVRLEIVTTLDELLLRAATNTWSTVFVSIGQACGGTDDLAVIRRLRQLLPCTPIVAMSLEPSISEAVSALHSGAVDICHVPQSTEAMLLRAEHWLEQQASASTHTTVVEAVRLIEARYRTPRFSVRQLARELGVSHEHLCRMLRQQTGKTFLQHLNQFRVRAAHNLLVHSNLRIKEVASRSGFSNTRHLDRRLRQLLGCSPSQLRRRNIDVNPKNYVDQDR